MSAEPRKPEAPVETHSGGPETLGPDHPVPTVTEAGATLGGIDPPARGTHAPVPGGTQTSDGSLPPSPSPFFAAPAEGEVGTVEIHAVSTAIGAGRLAPEGASQATSVFPGGSPPAQGRRHAAPDATAMTEAVGGFDRSSDATPAPKPPRYDPEAPRCGRYVLKHFHARGGMGEVWMAEDPVIGRLVALKRMFGQRPEQVRRFLVEARVTGQLEHPGIVPVHELGTNERGQPFYAMKFVQGRTLQEIIEEHHAGARPGNAGEVEQFRLLQIFLSLCQTVAYAHSRGVLHRDLKPENVMLGPYGETILLDWGIAKFIGQPDGAGAGAGAVADAGAEADAEAPADLVNLPDAEGPRTRVGAILGTPSYMAPEVALGKNDEVDRRSDVYLLGATLYEILTGRQPRRADTVIQMIQMARTESPIPPSKVNPRVPKALDAICRKAMARQKEARYPSALALAEDVQRYVAGEPVSAHREGIAARAWRWAKRHRTAMARAATAVLGVGLVAFVADVVRDAEHARAEAERGRLAATHRAETLLRENQARHDLKEFHRLADEARFFAATTGPVAENVPYFDPGQGEATALAALAIASKWGGALDRLPLADERDRLEHDLYDLLLLTAQLKNQRTASPRTDPAALVFLLAASGGPRSSPAPDSSPARAALALLDEAARLGEPSRGLYRLRAQAYGRLGERARALDDARRAEDPGRPATYLDHFLLGEQLRAEASGRDDPKGERKLLQPDPRRMEQAIDAYRKALMLAPDHYWSHYQLGRCYLGLGQVEEAVEALGTCIALRPAASWAYGARSLALAEQKRYREAERDLDQAARLAPDSRSPRLNRGALYLAQGKTAEALAEFDAVLLPPRDRQLVEAAYYRGLVHAQLGEPDRALADFDRAVAALPDFKAVYLDRARVLLARGKTEQALADLDRFRDLLEGRRLERGGWELHARRGRLLRLMYAELPIDQRGKGPAARALLGVGLSELRAAVKLQGRSAQLFDDTGALLELSGRLGEALQAYSAGLALEPANVRLLVKRGWAELQANRSEEALADFQAAVRADPEHAEAHAGLGYVQVVRKLRSGARHEAELALIQGVDKYLVLHNVACIYAALSETGDDQAAANQDVAIRLIRRAIDLWKKAEAGPSEIDLIKAEPAFRPLRNRADFQELIRGPS